jgi:hypothetical protein
MLHGLDAITVAGREVGGGLVVDERQNLFDALTERREECVFSSFLAPLETESTLLDWHAQLLELKGGEVLDLLEGLELLDDLVVESLEDPY